LKALFFSVSLLSLVGGAALAQDYLPQPAAPTPPIVAPQDVAYPGVLKL